MASVTSLNLGIISVSFIGILASYYAYLVETNNETNAEYTAMCDINEYMSCSKVLTSRFARGFGIIGPLLGEDSALNIPNSILGIVFYALFGNLCILNSYFAARLQFTLSFLSILSSFYFLYILYFVLQDLCVVCVTIHIVNLVNFILCCLKTYKLGKLLKPVTKLKKK